MPPYVIVFKYTAASFRLHLHISGDKAPPQPLGQPGWKGHPSPSRCRPPVGEFASWSSLYGQQEEEVAAAVTMQRKRTLAWTLVVSVTWAGFWESWSILNKVWGGYRSNFLPHWKKTQNFAFLFTYLTCNRKKKDLKFDKFSNNNLREVSAEMLKICFLPRFMKTEETKELHLSVITVSVTFNHKI